jgi:hypothetical protein
VASDTSLREAHEAHEAREAHEATRFAYPRVFAYPAARQLNPPREPGVIMVPR